MALRAPTVSGLVEDRVGHWTRTGHLQNSQLLHMNALRPLEQDVKGLTPQLLRCCREAPGHSCSHPQRRQCPSTGEACGKAEHILLSENRFYLKKKQMGRESAPPLMGSAGSSGGSGGESSLAYFPPVPEDELGDPHRPWVT